MIAGVYSMAMGENHGTRKDYKRGCRCDKCRAAWADYMRSRRHRLHPPAERRQQAIQREIDALEVEVAEAIEDERDSIEVCARLSPLAVRLLARAQAEKGMTRGEVLDALVREHVQHVAA